MFISRITTTTLAVSALALMSGTANAGNCSGSSLYCNSGSHGHSSHSARSTDYSVTLPSTHRRSSNYSVTLPSTHNYSSSHVVSDSYADAKYGSGSISESWSDSSTSYVPFSTPGSSVTSSTISGYSVPGLGANERLCPTACGDSVGVHGVGKGRVMGCYKVCKPAVVYTPRPVVQRHVVRVVRPIIYVRYPVVQRPVCPPVHVTTHYSRYGDYGYGAGRCGW